MEVFKAITERRSVRAYKDEPIPEEKLKKILKAATWAPSAGNRQSWEFVVVKNKKKKKKLVKGAYGQNFIAEAPVVIVVGANKKRSAERYGERGRKLYAIVDAAIATQNLLITAYSLGFGTCWIGAFRDEKIAEIVDFPKYIRPIGIIPLGKPAEQPSAPSRYPLERVVHKSQYSSD